MDPGLYRDAKRILLEALGLPAAQREDHVRRTCRDRPDLAAEVLSLLSREESVAPVVGEGLVKLSGGMPERIGPYEIVDVLGEGGMGVVYRGRQTQPIKRDVAVKVLHAGLNTARILERFAWERRSLARMNHPNIARILDAGSDEGRPYVVLELVEGTPITRWYRDREGDPGRRLALMERVCQAVQHAHDRGVLHRDLKPGNILVREVDGEPVPAIIDFGIAKALDETDDGESRVELTMDGQRVGTPAYMSPEQLRGDSDAVDVRTDVYALGVILYELLAGRRPFTDEHLQRSLSRDDPPAPSRAADRRELRGDLDAICLRAIQPEPGRRYRSAAELGEDLRNYRTGRPVVASPDTWRYRARKLVRRHPALATLAAAVLVFAVAGVAFLGYHAQRLDRERLRALAAEAHARQEADAAEEIAGFLENLFIEMDPVEEGQAPASALELLDQGARRLESGLEDQPANRGRLWGVVGRVNQNLARHELAEGQLRLSLAAFAEAPDTVATLAARAEVSRMLAICLHDLGRYAESEAAFRNTLALHERAYPGLEVVRVQLVTDLATAIQAQGRIVEALGLLAEALEMARSLGDEGAPEVAYIGNLRGYLLYQRGRYVEAIEAMEAALAAQRGLLAEDNFDLVNSLNNVGGMNIQLGRLDAAEAAIVESKEMLERIFQGEDHPAITRAILHLGRIAVARGDTAQAIALLEDGYAKNLAQMGPDHPSTWAAEVSLAKARECQGRDAEARTLYDQAVTHWLEGAGPQNFKTLFAHQEYGEFLLRTGDLDAARRQYQAAIDGWRANSVPGHPRLLQSQVGLAGVLWDEGDGKAAVELAEGALPGLIEVFGGDADPVRRARELLARAR